MKSRLLVASRNPKKKKELEELLAELALHIVTLDELGISAEVEEDGKTFEENAIKKATLNASWSGYPCLADDSGLEVDALGGQPGVYSARFAGDDVDDASNNQKLLALLQGVPEVQRTARFVAVIAVSAPDGQVVTVRGSCEGHIAMTPAGTGGFGYDPLFIPSGFTRTFAELTAEEKHAISHRGQALQKIKPVLRDYFSL